MVKGIDTALFTIKIILFFSIIVTYFSNKFGITQGTGSIYDIDISKDILKLAKAERKELETLKERLNAIPKDTEDINDKNNIKKIFLELYERSGKLEAYTTILNILKDNEPK